MLTVNYLADRFFCELGLLHTMIYKAFRGKYPDEYDKARRHIEEVDKLCKELLKLVPKENE